MANNKAEIFKQIYPSGVTCRNINGALIDYLQGRLKSSESNINGLLAGYAAARSARPAPPNNLKTKN